MRDEMENRLETLATISRDVIGPCAALADRECRFPHESIEALKSIGLLGFFVPREHGGMQGTVGEYCNYAALIGEHCLSSAIIWTMHCQQVAAMALFPFPRQREVLRELATRPCLVASVTSEYGKGGDLLRTVAPVFHQDDAIILKRKAPIVSYGKEARYFLITMKGGEEQNSTRLYLVSPEDGQIKVEGTWNSLGMRGTQSIPMSFDVKIPPDRAIGPDFLDIALRSMVPIGHLGWASSWFGAAKGLNNRVLHSLRVAGAKGKRKLDSDLLRHRLGEIRMLLDMIESIIGAAKSRFETMLEAGSRDSAYRDITFNILVNNVKVAVSEFSFSVVNKLMEIAGLFEGYLLNEDNDLERIFRDIRSATLMFSNDRLLDANGQLALVEKQHLFAAT